MKFYFGKVDPNYFADGYDSPEGYFCHNGSYYYHELSFNAEGDIIIKDTVNRSVPIDLESALQLFDIFRNIVSDVQRIVTGDKSFDFLQSDRTLCV